MFEQCTTFIKLNEQKLPNPISELFAIMATRESL